MVESLVNYYLHCDSRNLHFFHSVTITKITMNVANKIIAPNTVLKGKQSHVFKTIVVCIECTQ